jgi:ribonuclease HI
MAKEKKYYVVWEGHQRGVFDRWEDRKKQTDGYKNINPSTAVSKLKPLLAARQIGIFNMENPQK